MTVGRPFGELYLRISLERLVGVVGVEPSTDQTVIASVEDNQRPRSQIIKQLAKTLVFPLPSRANAVPASRLPVLMRGLTA